MKLIITLLLVFSIGLVPAFAQSQQNPSLVLETIEIPAHFFNTVGRDTIIVDFEKPHIIIGRDHAGVGNYYDPFAAQKIFDDYPDLEITPVFFPAFFYCKKCLNFANDRVCPHDVESREQLSGTKLRSIIQEGKSPSEFILRPEISKIILGYDKPFVD